MLRPSAASDRIRNGIRIALKPVLGSPTSGTTTKANSSDAPSMKMRSWRIGKISLIRGIARLELADLAIDHRANVERCMRADPPAISISHSLDVARRTGPAAGTAGRRSAST